jgi:hypothetical protein
MFLLFTDETNLPSDPGAKFFAYGGLVVPAKTLPDLGAAIASIRKDMGYKPGDSLKFSTNARPAHVTVENARVAKERVIQSCLDLKCLFIIYVILHAIAKNDQDNLVKFGANSVIGRFNYFLTQENDHGICVVDRLPNATEYKYLSEKFSEGLDIQGQKKVQLDRIHLFASTCDNASHASSAMDITLGAFRYCINATKKTDAASSMMRKVANMLWHIREGKKIHASGRGLILSPQVVKVAQYKQEYTDLLAHINNLMKPDDPTPTA